MPDSKDLAPGPEMDAVAAKACGCAYDTNKSGDLFIDGYPFFRPSVDVNAAFHSAEKAGLWYGPDDAMRVLCYNPFSGWHVLNSQAFSCAQYCGSRGTSTPAEAICRAIIELAESR